jgi:hypothetical protein
MKRIGLVIGLISIYFISYSQTIYSVSQIPFAPNTVTSDTFVSLSDDAYSAKLLIGFTFVFFGENYDELVVSSNGSISFDLTRAMQYSNWVTAGDTIPMNSIDYNNSIMSPYQDMNGNSLGINGNIRIRTAGIYPNRTLTISFNQIPLFSCNNMVATSQIILFETSNNIEIHLENKPLCTNWNSGHAILGIQNKDGTEAFYPPNKNGVQTWTANQEAWRFTSLGSYLSTSDLITNKNKLHIYPSPAQDFIYIQNNPSNSIEYSIMNVFGQKVKEGSYTTKIDISDLTNGIYWLKTANSHYNKFIKN